MMKTIKTIFLIGAFILFGACKKYLEEVPDKRLAIPTTLEDFQLLLNSQVSPPTARLGDISSDDLNLSLARYNAADYPYFRNAYLWKADVFQGADDDDWSDAYNSIYYANNVLEGIAKVSVNASNMKQHQDIEGQALFLRANAFYELQEQYGQVYLPETASSALGIPLRLNSNLTERYQRATVQQTYNQIIGDLQKALDLLPAEVNFSNRGRPTKATVYGLLSRVYLSLRDYKKAGEYATNSLKIYGPLTDYRKLDNNLNNPFTFLIDEVLYYRTQNPYFLSSVDPELYQCYEENDLRKIIFFRTNSVTGEKEFKGYYTGDNYTPFSGIATDELMLTQSECLARQGQFQGAIDVLNKLLESRYRQGTFVRRSASPSEVVLPMILLERRKELLFRGIRWKDLRRLNQEPIFTKTLRRELDGKLYELKPNSPNYALPIPDQEIRLSGIIQNPRQ